MGILNYLIIHCFFGVLCLGKLQILWCFFHFWWFFSYQFYKPSNCFLFFFAVWLKFLFFDCLNFFKLIYSDRMSLFLSARTERKPSGKKESANAVTVTVGCIIDSELRKPIDCFSCTLKVSIAKSSLDFCIRYHWFICAYCYDS